MRPYDPGSPLIFLHVPKTAGTSLREIFRGWFGPGLLEHYAGVHDGSLPLRHDLSALPSAGHPLAIYGHFNRRRGFGVDDDYPEVRQFVTALGRSVDSAGLPRLNVNAAPVEEVGDLREEFMANHPLDYELYRCAWERSSPSDAPRRRASASG